MTYPTIDDLMLEVETDPAGLTNLVQNPSGALGGYAWVTPVSGATLVGDPGSGYGQVLRYTATAAPNFFYTEPMAVTAGEYVAASWVVPYVSTHYRVKVEWLDAGFAVLSSATQTGYLTASTSTQYYGPYLAPASTVYARLRFDHYSSAAGANPLAGYTLVFKEVTVAKAATSGELGTLRTNLVTNPSFETNTTGWGAFDGSGIARGTIARSTAQFAVGTASCAVTSNGSYATIGIDNFAAKITIEPNKTYAVQARVRPGTTARRARIGSLAWYTASDVYISGVGGAFVNEVAGSWVTVSATATAPSNAAKLKVLVSITHADGSTILPNGEVHYIDAVMVEQASTVGSYFDGATAAGGGITYGWTGTAHGSKSTATTSNLAYIEPTTYLNILGPTHDIKVVREELNLGTLDATILDATIDPSQGSLIRPGRKVRLSVLKPSGAWEPLFTGKVSFASVKYNLKATSDQQARITLSAVDNVGTLGSSSRTIGVASIDDLPYVLEGAGVPWVVNGSSNQVASATTVSKNDSASALDQVAITRDSKRGYAWVDRNNTLRVYDANKMPSKNLLPNPNFAVDASGWSADTLSTITRVASVARVSGNPVLKMTSTGTGTFRAATTGGGGGVPVTAGLPMTASVDFYVDPTGILANKIPTSVSVRWYDSAFTLLSTSTSSLLSASSGVWRSVSAGFTAPASAAFASLVVNATGLGSGNTLYLRNASLSTEPYVTLDETIYSDMDVDYSTERCINEVVIKYLRYNVGSGETTEVVYGPYRNAGSISIWGVRRAEFTVHGITESGANMQAFADAVLAANANPTIRTNGVTIPVLDVNDLPFVLADLYSPVITSNASRNLYDYSRVSGIEHTIEPGRWLTKLSFTDTQSVASPQVTPPVVTTATGPPHSDRYQSSALSIATGTTFVPLTFGTNTETTGIGFSGGTWTVQRAGRYLITCTIGWAGNATGRRMLRNLINGSEANRVETNPDDTNNFTQTLTRAQRLAVGDTVAFDVIQTSGGALNVNAGPSQTQAQVTWLGD